MKFIVSRTSSSWLNPEQPHPDTRSEKYDQPIGIALPEAERKIEVRTRWFIRFTTLKGLIEWVDKLDEQVILSVDGDEIRLEIYDDYRE